MQDNIGFVGLSTLQFQECTDASRSTINVIAITPSRHLQDVST
jgi:hypothetical protein